MSSRWVVVGGLAMLGFAACSANEGPATDDAGTGSASDSASAASDAAISATDAGSSASADGSAAFVGFDAAAFVSTDDGDAAACGALTAVIRDFRDSHPDFEHYMGTGVTKGIVADMLDDARKPVYANPVYSGAPQTTGRTEFDQWYRDVDGVNQPFMIEIPVVAQGGSGLFVYDSAALQPPGFFPIDGKGFGNQGRAHNYHFTTEIHTSFMYRGGEVFTFRGDDDLWLFVNGQLALDLGGLHSPVAGTVNFDALASKLGISTGNTYNMDIFHAERHTVESNFRIETSIDCFVPVILR